MDEIIRLDLNDRDAAEQLWALQHAAYREEARRIGVSDLPPLRDTIDSLQASAENFYGCYNTDGELVGAVSTELEGRTTVIRRMMVHPEYFRRGIGSRLLRHVLAVAGPAGEVTVTAEARNEPAVRLYERQGFRPLYTFSPSPGFTMVELSTGADRHGSA